MSGLLMLWLLLGGVAALAPVVYADGGRLPSRAPNTADHTPTRLSIPSLNLDIPILPAGWVERSGRRVWLIPDNAAGWHLGSARLGERGNLVLSGHNNIGGSVFRNLADLRVGDMVVVSSQTTSRQFEVTERLILREAFQSEQRRLENARWIGDFEDERVTLVTCYPAWSNTHRLIIVAKPVEPSSTSIARRRILIEE